ncbi:MAG: hypothetical protein KDD24_05350 [Flavobacteriales bacterium]|nr:hypothetical protein [Flavobacteriales bacterium]MCB9174604.1 hypothetical protein [Flavobacteriales bacterium]
MEKVKNWILTHKKNIILAIIGAIAGYLYWYYVGCESGSCAITSVWYRTTIYGALMGWLLSDVSFKQTKKEKTNEE